MTTTMRNALALIALALALAAPARAQIYPGYGTPTRLGSGSAALPSYSFTADGTSGFYLPVVGAVDLAIGGTTSHRWNSDYTNFIGSINIGNDTGVYALGAGADVKLRRAGAGTLGVTAGGATATFANVSGVLLIEANNVTQSSVSQNLHSYTVPANVMTTNGKTLRVTALFLSVNNANAKAIGFTICGGSLTFNATVSIAGALRATAYITRTAANTWTTSVTIEEGLASGTLTQAKLSGTYNSTPACTDSATNTIAASVNTAGATDTSSGFFMVELLN